MDYTQKTKEILDRIEKETGISRNIAAGFASLYLLCGREHEVKERAKHMLDIVDEELEQASNMIMEVKNKNGKA